MPKRHVGVPLFDQARAVAVVFQHRDVGMAGHIGVRRVGVLNEPEKEREDR